MLVSSKFLNILVRCMTAILCFSVAELTATEMSLTIKPCPNKPNCVSSIDESTSHYIEPFSFNGNFDSTKIKLLSAINALPRTKIIRENDNYLHVTFTSALFRFVDDVEFYFDEVRKVIHLRSASRAGYYDFGANRHRIETIRAKYSEQ